MKVCETLHTFGLMFLPEISEKNKKTQAVGYKLAYPDSFF